jgi:hypothetical protein
MLVSTSQLPLQQSEAYSQSEPLLRQARLAHVPLMQWPPQQSEAELHAS